MTVLHRNLYPSVRSLDKIAEELDGISVVFVEGDALVIIDSRDKGLRTEGNGSIEKLKLEGLVLSVNSAVFLDIMIPSSYR